MSADSTRTAVADEAGRVQALAEAFSRLAGDEPRLEPFAEELRALVERLENARADRARADAHHREREAQIQQIRKMQALGRLAGAIAHDFNNLLTVIMIHADFLLESLENGSQAWQDAMAIQTTTERAQRLTRQLVSIGQPKGEERRPTDLRVMVGRFVDGALDALPSDIRLVVDLAPGPAMVDTDAALMTQALENLLANAKDAMAGRGTVGIRTRQLELDAREAAEIVGLRPGPHFVLSVSDDGAGMSEEVASRALEPFFTTRDRTRWAGLGLTAVYGIVGRSRGAVRIESEVGKGTTVTLFLPITSRACSENGPRITRETAEPAFETVLLVEDQDPVRASLSRILEENGYTVLAAPDGPAALAVVDARADDIHLLVTDIIMPGMTGWEVAERVVRARASTRVLFISGYTDQIVPMQAIDGSGVRLLKKPFSRAEFLGAVRGALDGAPGARLTAPS